MGFKTLFIAAVLLGEVSLACTEYSAQFIAEVKDHQGSSEGTCSYLMNFSQFNTSFLCPLDIDVVYRHRFADDSCQLKNGDVVSGVMVLKDDVLTIE